MKRTKKAVSLILLCAFTLMLLVGCNTQNSSNSSSNPTSNSNSDTNNAGSAGDTSAGDKESYIFGYSAQSIDENTNKQYEMFIEARDKYVAENSNVEIEVILTDAGGNIAKQHSDCEDLVAAGCHVVRTRVADPEAGVPTIEYMVSEGVKVLSTNACNTDVMDVQGTGFDNESMGLLIGEQLEKLLASDNSLELNIGIIYGSANSTDAMRRADAATEYLMEKYSDRVNIVDARYGEWTDANAMAIMEDWITAYPEMNCVIACSGIMGIAAMNAIKSANLIDSYYVCGVDGTDSELTAIEEGDYYCSIMMNHRYVEEAWFDIMLQLARDEEVPHEVSLGTESLLCVTAENVEEARALH